MQKITLAMVAFLGFTLTATQAAKICGKYNLQPSGVSDKMPKGHCLYSKSQNYLEALDKLDPHY